LLQPWINLRLAYRTLASHTTVFNASLGLCLAVTGLLAPVDTLALLQLMRR
jgi:hypothetical protein